MRLDKLLLDTGFGSRNQIKKLIRSRQVRVDGLLVTKEGLNVDANLQRVEVSGKVVRLDSQVYYMLYKPAGVVSARKDKQHQTVIDLVRQEDQREGLYPIGRLDRDTEGLVLLTNNGPLGFRMLHPSRHVEKTYLVKVNGFLSQDAISLFSKGIVFHGGIQCRSAHLEILSSTEEESLAKVTLSEGKFHQVKKMFLTVGVKVTYLKRISFGGFELDSSLEPGQYRPLDDKEKQLLKQYFD